MTIKEINTFKQKTKGYIDRRRLRQAISELKDVARAAGVWSVIDALERTEQNYAYMLRYMADGSADPERAGVYDGIVIDLYGALDDLVLALEKAEYSTLYYNTLRVRSMLRDTTAIPALIDAYAQSQADGSLFEMLASGDQAATQQKRLQAERQLSELFMAVWVTPSLSSADYEAIKTALEGSVMPVAAKVNLTWALTMGLLSKFDKRKLMLLICTYQSGEDVKLTSAALIGLLLGLWTYRNRPLPRQVADALAAARDTDHWHSDLKIAFIELIRARDTERINRKIREEVIPDMLNLRPEIMDKINDGSLNPNDMASLQENPEWQELLDKNGITDKLKELTEMQMEGGDVMMSTFAHLKNFPFFNDISNWFLPYDPSHSAVEKENASIGIVSDMIDKAKFLCDNDKYSFIMALRMVPEQQRQLMTSQFMSQSDNIYEAMSENESATAPEARRKDVNLQMQNLYRFFKLFKRKDEFSDPFDTGVNLIAVPSLASEFDDLEMLQVVAEFYFKLNYWRDALDVFTRMEDILPGDAQRYQKMGYCCEKLQNLPKAIEYYQRAELLDADSRWTRRRLAACYRAVGDKDKALEYYRALSEQDPDDLQTALLLGYVQLENEDLQEALQQFYKVEFLNEKSTKAFRPLAWTLFLTGDFQASRKYYAKILADSPTANDYLNMGHATLAVGDTRSAINYYSLYLQDQPQATPETLAQALEQDAASLKRAGVDMDIIPLVVDAVAYNLER